MAGVRTAALKLAAGPGRRPATTLPAAARPWNPRGRLRCPRPRDSHTRVERCSGQFLYDIAALDTAPEWTLDQIAGLVFGGLLVALYFSSKFIDDYAAASQRRQLGLCEKCGGLYDSSSCQERNCPERGN